MASMPRLPSGQIKVPLQPQRRPILVDVTSGKYRLKSLKAEDVRTDWLDWISDPAVMEGLNAATRRMTLDEMRAYVARFDHIVRSLVGIFDGRSDALVGLVMVEADLRHQLASVHLLVGNKRFWGRGAAIAAGEAIVRHCFDARSLEKVIFCPLADNQPAIAVCLYHRLRLEGIFRSHRAGPGGKRLDQLQFAITREEYLERKRERGEA